MPTRWFDIPNADWVALNAKLRGAFRDSGVAGVQSVSTSSTLTLTASPTLVLVNTSSGNVTLTLPPASEVAGFRLEVKKLTSPHTLTLDASGSETIDGAATLAWSTQYQSFALFSDGTAWHIV